MSGSESGLRLLEEHFGFIEDPRLDRHKEHLLLDIIGLTIIGTLSGADNWVAIEEFGKAKELFLKDLLVLPNGIPSHDTLGRVFSILSAEEVEKGFASWISNLSQVTQGQVVAIDGKRLRGSYDKGSNKAAIHMVSAWATANQVSLGQLKVGDKSNEISAIPELLSMLEIAGCIITIDAMGTQKEIAQQIRAHQADYVLALKSNQGELYEEVKATFEHLINTRFCQQDQQWDKGHGRIESRKCYVLDLQAPDFDWILSQDLEQWKDISSLIMIQATRWKGDQVQTQNRYYISSLSAQNKDAQAFNHIVRTHWAIENQLHWTLDVVFKEDASRVRSGYADQNLSVIRRLALNLLKQDKSLKVGIQNKRMRAAWDNQYLIKIINQAV
ncbi:ISAs1 family transposase [Okeania hirsuta]|uniref:ISAs1 family transposase n=1 Tax=Okeania hirsuta TaxID=1458930 RepID=A0A3N6NQH8_9CYAN|nr:ISAs1 family transposase [Okeania hirsuta]RQH18932.1 ISAs1 family transposase [Okeania hirsuta]